VGVTHAKQSQRSRKGASLDVRDRRVDLERLCDRDATLGAEIVAPQAAVTKNANIKVEVTHAKQRQRSRKEASLDVRVDLESLGDRDATLGAEFVVHQAEKGEGNKNGMIGMLLPSR
jgi:hypothetical protein